MQVTCCKSINLPQSRAILYTHNLFTYACVLARETSHPYRFTSHCGKHYIQERVTHTWAEMGEVCQCEWQSVSIVGKRHRVWSQQLHLNSFIPLAIVRGTQTPWHNKAESLDMSTAHTVLANQDQTLQGCNLLIILTQLQQVRTDVQTYVCMYIRLLLHCRLCAENLKLLDA